MKAQLQALLVLTVTLVLFALLFTNEQPVVVILAVVVILTNLILVVGGAAKYLPRTLSMMLKELRRVIFLP